MSDPDDGQFVRRQGESLAYGLPGVRLCRIPRGVVEEHGMAGSERQVPDGAVPLLECKFDQTSLSSLRGELARCGAANGLADPALPNVVLAINEIATNAVRYAGGHGQLQLWRFEGSLFCRVADDGPGIPRRHLDESHRSRPGYIDGHGLWLARQIADSLAVETDRSGTCVLLRFALRPLESTVPRSANGVV
jgi:serine/threonine-protein kinase RsbW